MTTELRVYGYNTDNTANREESSIVRMIFFMYVVCELSHEQIAFHLNRLNTRWAGTRMDRYSCVWDSDESGVYWAAWIGGYSSGCGGMGSGTEADNS
jgi:hypothetical protein